MPATPDNRSAMNRIETLEILKKSLSRLEEYVRVKDYEGMDPYDALNSPILASLPGRIPKLAATQFFVYSPWNLRGLLRTPQGKNPKGLALFIRAYCSMRRSNLISDQDFRTAVDHLSKSLMKCRTEGYHGNCWGYNFPWQDLKRYTKVGLPSIVVSSTVGNAFLDLFEITQDGNDLETAVSICDFIINDLNIYEDEKGICFSYTPIDNFVTHNANIIGAALLSRSYFYTGNTTLLDYARRAADFTVANQEEDGSWAYSMNKEARTKRMQIDFHQGFIIDALADFVRYSGLSDKRYGDAVVRGVKFFWENQFDSLGRSMWRLPWRYPIDIHHQAQGIISFSKLADLDSRYLALAQRIALWTIGNMQSEAGYFYYQRWGPYTNKIPYMRWGQAWMMLSLSQVLNRLIEGDRLERSASYMVE